MKQLVIKLVQYLHTVLTKTTGAQQRQHGTGVRRWNSNPRFVSTWVWKLSDLSGHQLFHSSNALNQRTQNFVLSAQGSFRTLPPRSLTWGLGTQSILSSAANIHFTLEGSSLSTCFSYMTMPCSSLETQYLMFSQFLLQEFCAPQNAPRIEGWHVLALWHQRNLRISEGSERHPPLPFPLRHNPRGETTTSIKFNFLPVAAHTMQTGITLKVFHNSLNGTQH